MIKRIGLLVRILLITILIVPSLVFGQERKVIKLPKPQLEIGKPLMQVLKNRKSSREFSNKKLSEQTLANLLWAGYGINRSDGKRTAPSSMNMQETSIYVATDDGLYLYDAKENVLNLIIKEDIRALTGKQLFVKDAPINLIYVSDISKMGKMAEKDIYLNAGADVGFIAQNVYLYCASEGLATVVRGYVDVAMLSKKMNLKNNQKIILAQSVGYHK
ncbi:MAG: hypothetical protein A2474_01770 [Elusimicrobia bacterium RIFOXYC2_FULL_34_12]|nr:MAG: hypothetical protein A2474_01770 [Elusimicrobia bacterium RIFOXYC2_FULL_34_12]OGS39033.1 MAG: hypothetical protein A2551_07370 [Elusimicrobia bacterium RIFOXYD2_FULL_34_30]HAM39696.1 nitroreductase [Elusimicrobiota bacterium]